jgi:hypothetical protein
VTWESSSLAPGGSRTARLVVDVARNLDTGSELANRARVRVVDTPAYGALAHITTTVVSSPSLWVTISDGQTSALAGEELIYTIGYQNTGSGRAYGTRIAVTPPAAELVSQVECVPPSACTVQGGQLIYNVGTVPGGGSGAVQMRVVMADPLPAGAGDVVAAAEISTSTPGDPPEGNSAQDVDTIGTRPDLVLKVAYQDIGPRPGKRITYTVEYSNAGRILTGGVYLTALQPMYTTYEVDGSNLGWYVHRERLYRYDVGELDYGEGGELLFVVTLTDTLWTPAITDFDALFEIHDDGVSGPDAKASDNTVMARLGVPNLVVEDVVVDPAVWVGEPGYMTVTVRNTGAGPACGVAQAGLPCTAFSLDLFFDPTDPPESYPIERFGPCYAFVSPIQADQTATVPISFTLGSYFNVPGLCGAGLVQGEIWLHTDNWDPAQPPYPPQYGQVPENNEFDNVYGPVRPARSIYLPIVVRNGP